MQERRISVVIPIFNPGPELSALLDALARQTLPPHEIILVDSTPGGAVLPSPLAGEGPGVRGSGLSNLKIVPWTSPFNHGLARDAGIAQSSAEIVALTVQDALPPNDWIERLATHFDDPSVAGVSGRQVP